MRNQLRGGRKEDLPIGSGEEELESFHRMQMPEAAERSYPYHELFGNSAVQARHIHEHFSLSTDR